MVIRYSKEALKFLAKIDKQTTERIREAIYGLTQEPPHGDIKVLQGYPGNYKRLRVGKYRVIFTYEQDATLSILYIVDIGSRGDIYK